MTNQELSIFTLLNQLPMFEKKIKDLCQQLSLSYSDFQCDHLALRVNTISTATHLHQELTKIGRTISNKHINGRPIIIIKLHTSISFLAQQVDCIELPYPSNKIYKVEGWEHAEFVYPCEVKTSQALLAKLIEFQPNLQDIIKSTKLAVKFSQPHGKTEQLANPTIAFKDNDCCIKIHPHSIENIIASEN